MDINERIWELVSGYVHKELSPEEANELNVLIQNEDSARILEQAVRNFHDAGQLRPLRQISGERSWKRITASIRRERIRRLLNISKYAAIVLLALIVGSLFNPARFHRESQPGSTEISVPLGQMSQIKLPDGTEVWLNSGTTLSFGGHFGENKRDVRLDGEAFFKVKPGQIPFRLKLKNSEVEVLGTSFNVISFKGDSSSEVTLVKGKVKINTPEGKNIVVLKPGEQISLSDDLKNKVVKTVDTGFFTSWTDGKIVFEEEKLADISKKLERWYNVEIILSDREVGDLRFSGTILKNKPFDQIVKAFSLLLPVNIQYTNNINKKDAVTISKKQMPM